MNKEELNDIVCQSSSDYEILDNAYDYIEKLEQENKSLQSQLKEKEEENKQLKEELKYTVPIVEYNKMVSKKLKQNQKYKEVIDKAINLIVKETKSMPMNGCKIRLIELLDILKEVE